MAILAKKKTSCYWCSATIEAGAKAQWYLRQGLRGGSRAKGSPDRWVLCCDGDYAGQCEVNRQDAERDAERVKAEKETADQMAKIKEMTEAGSTVEDILDFLGIPFERKVAA